MWDFYLTYIENYHKLISPLEIITHPDVELIFNNYPDFVRQQMLDLRGLIIETAQETEAITTLEEALRWGEPSYLTNIGSTIRMDWKQKTTDQYALYFQCTSKLIETFRALFKNTFDFEGKRAIVFKLEDEVPMDELKYCIRAALIYHKVKHLPTLGI